MAESRISDIIRASFSGIDDIIDVNTIMGEPIEVKGGTTIIPIAKVALGLATGGVDYLPKSAKNSEKNEKSEKAVSATGFGGAGGTGVSMTPVGFLVVKSNGTVDLLSMSAATGSNSTAGVVDTVIDVIDRSPELYEKIKGIIVSLSGGVKNAGDEKTAEPEEEKPVQE